MRRNAYSVGAPAALAVSGVSDAVPQRLRHAGDVGGAEDRAGVDAGQVGQLVARPSGRQQVDRHQLLLRQDQQTVWLIRRLCSSHSTT